MTKQVISNYLSAAAKEVSVAGKSDTTTGGTMQLTVAKISARSERVGVLNNQDRLITACFEKKSWSKFHALIILRKCYYVIVYNIVIIISYG